MPRTLIMMQCIANPSQFHLWRCPVAVQMTVATGLCLLLGACTSTDTPDPAAVAEPPHSQISALLREAEAGSGGEAVALFLQAAEQSVRHSLLEEAADILQRMDDIEDQNPVVRLRYAMVQARLAQARGKAPAAIDWLTGPLVAAQDSTTADGAAYFSQLGRLYQDQNRHADAVKTLARVTAFHAQDTRSDVFEQIWRSLQQLRDEELQSVAASATSYELRGWTELARVYRAADFNLRTQLDAILRWQRTWASHSAAERLPRSLGQLQSVWNARPRHIALILPLGQTSGRTIQEGFFSAYYNALETTTEVPRVTVFDSSDAADVFAVYDQAVAAGVDLIIGPLGKTLVNQLALVSSLPVPTLALNYLDSNRQVPENLYQFGLAPEDEIAQLTELAWQAGHRHAAVLTPQSQQYTRLHDEFALRWERFGGQIVSTTVFADTTDYSDTVKRLLAIDSSEARAERLLRLLPRNNMEFVPRRRQDIDFIFLVANPGQGRLIKPTLAFYFAENVPVYSMPSIHDGMLNPAGNRDLDGLWFADAPFLLQHSGPIKQAINDNLRPASGPLQRLRALGVDSFRLYTRLQQLAQGSVPAMPGATGVLQMEVAGRITRRLNIARFVNGLAQEQASSVTGN